MRSRRWVLGAGVAAALSLAIAAGAGAQGTPGPTTTPAVPSASALIIPGRGIGNWTLDQVIYDFVYNLGPSINRGETSQPGPLIRNNLLWQEWTDPPIVALSAPTDLAVTALATSGPAFKTPEGIGTGATADQVQAAYGDPQIVIQAPLEPKVVIYDDQGVAFQFSFGSGKGYGNVERVFVFRPKQARTVWRMP